MRATLPLLFASLLSTSLAEAQAPDAATVAVWVTDFYTHTPEVDAEFTQHFWLRDHDRTTTSTGRLRIERPGRFRFDYADGDVWTGDGETC